jgi:phosphatidylglycerol:prolipoprotein diacylglycerol transferase
MIPFTPSPVLFSIGPVAVRFYGLAYAIGFLLSYWALRRSSLREHADDLTLWIMVGVIVGGRVGEFIFYSPTTFFTDPLEVLRIWHGGMSFHGGLLGTLIALGWYTHKHKLSLLHLADILVFPASIAIILGRIANFLNGELVGTVTNVPWCIVMEGVQGCRHPNPLYEAFYTLIILAVLLGMRWHAKRTNTKRAEGALFAVFLVLYGALRFVFNFWREDLRFLGISTGQYLSIATLLFGAWLLWHIVQTKTQRPTRAATPKTNTIKKRRGRGER